MLYGSVGRVGLRALSGTSFSPLSLFANGEQGGWYDPSDLTTLYQDAAGTTPVTAVEQPVGLVLDKSKGLVLGSELVTNGDFSNGTTGWTVGPTSTFSVVDGQIKAVSTSADAAYFGQLVPVVAGKFYEVRFTTVSDGTAKIARVFVGSFWSGVAITPNSFGTHRVIWQATSTGNVAFWPYGSSGGAGTYILCDNISVRELPGNHLSQSTAAARPVLSARVNLLTYTEEFDNAAWTKDGGTITADGAISPIGTTTAERMTTNGTANTLKSVYQAHSLSAISYTVSVCVKDNGSTSRDFHIFVATNSLTVTVGTTYNFDTDTLTTQADATPFSGISASRTSLGSGWYRITLNFTVANAQTVRFYITAPYVAAKAGDFYIWGADLRPSNAGVGLPAYQRVGAATDYDTTGFPLYLKFDGTDDSLATGTIDPGAVDKAQMFAGVRKLSDASTQMFCEYSTNIGSNTGSLALNRGDYATGLGAYWIHGARGAATLASNQFATTPANYAAPITSVLAGYSDISGDLSVIRVNGTEQATATGDKGSGDWGSYPLYVGRRGGTSYPFSGSLYSLILRFSATNLDAATITATETWVNQRTKAF